MANETQFKLTYSTMFNPPEELHIRFDEALSQVKANLGREHALIIGGKDRLAVEKFENRSPVDTDVVLGIFQKGSPRDAQDAIAAARRAFPAWSRTSWQERVALLRKAAEIMDRRIFEMGVVVAMEVGKNRMEALGDVAETADLIRYACERMEANQGLCDRDGPRPIGGLQFHQHFGSATLWRLGGDQSVQLPGALTGGPWVQPWCWQYSGHETRHGYPLDGPPDRGMFAGSGFTGWSVQLCDRCRAARLGQALIDSPDVDGITFTGSFDVGMKIFRDFGHGKYIRPTILELGGKNPAIVSRHANLEDAAIGIIRSAFGLQGQKCSACSRVLVEDPVYDQLARRLVELTNKMVIGDPTERSVYLGPVVNKPPTGIISVSRKSWRKPAGS